MAEVKSGAVGEVASIIPATSQHDVHPGGSLFVLPREMRDQIYCELVVKIYLVYGIPFHYCDRRRKPEKSRQCDLAILRTCKILNSEVSTVLFSKALFRFNIDYDDARKLPPALPKSLTDRMMKVDFILNQNSFDESREDSNNWITPSMLRPLIRDTLWRFTGNDIQRQSCGVLLWAINHTVALNEFLSSPMALALGKMIGFKQVIIEAEDQHVSLGQFFFDDESESESSDSDDDSEEYFEKGQGRVDEDFTGEERGSTEENQSDDEWDVEWRVTRNVERYTKHIRALLECTLGPSEEITWSGRPEDKSEVATTLCLTFHPRDYTVSQAKEVGVEESEEESEDS